MNQQPSSRPVGMLVATLVGAVFASGLVAAWRIDWWGEQGNGLSPRFGYSLEAYRRVDPALVGYDEVDRVPVALREARTMAVGPEDRLYVAGDLCILCLSPSGNKLATIALEEEPQCVAVGGAGHAFPGRMYVGLKDRVEVYGPEGKRVAHWESQGPKALFTSIALAEHDVYVANARGRVVLRYDLQGKLLGQIDGRDPDKDLRGFIIPSPYFDLAMAPDGLLRVVNPGMHRIEAYTAEGHLEQKWGKATVGIEGFCGCCNPAHIALLDDGSVVTAEKGLPRVKVYSSEGQFVCVVAGPEMLCPTATITEETRTEHKMKVHDVAVDSQGRILVLDPSTQSVRVFQKKRQ